MSADAVGHQPSAEMRLIMQPDRQSCNACAWAMVLGLTREALLAAVPPPEDGILDDDDLTWWAVEQGYTVTQLNVALNRWNDQPDYLAERRLARQLVDRRGVLAVTHPEIPEGLHAIAWDGEDVFDPLLGHRPLWEYRLHGFLWIERIGAGRAAA